MTFPLTITGVLLDHPGCQKNEIMLIQKHEMSGKYGITYNNKHQ